MSLVVMLLLALQTSQEDTSLEAKRLVDALRSDKVEERNEAARLLIKLGSKAVPALEKAETDKDVDVSRIAKELLDDILCRVPEKAFRKLEETFLTSKSLTIKYRKEFTANPIVGDVGSSISGTITLCEGDRVSVDLTTVSTLHKEDSVQSTIVSDGKMLLVKGITTSQRRETPPELSRNLIRFLVRLGWWEASWGRVALSDHYNIDEDYTFENFAFGQNAKEGKTLTYTVRSKNLKGPAPPITFEISLVFNPNTYVILHRTTTGKCGSAEPQDLGTETFNKVILNEPISGEFFKVPPER